MLLFTFLCSRVVLLWERFGEVIGFDSGAQIEMVRKLSWAMPDTPIRESFYGYHPPLGFLLARTITFLGLTPEQSIQMVSFAASLLAFFFLRETLKHVRVLQSPSGMGFLYGTSSIPIQISLTTSVNLDVIVLAMGSAVLCASVHLLWPSTVFDDAHHDDPVLPLRFPLSDPVRIKHLQDRVLACTALTVALVCATLTKFSGVLLLAIPPMTAWSQPYRLGWWKRCSIGAVATCTALAIAFPYYYGRYYLQEGSFFPLNTEWTAKADVERAIITRDANPMKFFMDLFLPTTVHAVQGPTHTDYEVNRLVDAWRDLWLRNQWTGSMDDHALKVGLVYMHFVPWLLIIGGIFFVMRMRRRTAWSRLGWVLLAFSSLQILALIQYIYRIPFAGYGPAKGMYILPTVWGIGYLAVTAFREERLLPRTWRHYTPVFQHALLGAVLLIIVINHSIPVY